MRVVNGKNSWFAAGLSCIHPGLGQMYCGLGQGHKGQFKKDPKYYVIDIMINQGYKEQFKKGFIYAVIGILFAYISPEIAYVWLVVNILDAFTTAEKMNRGESFDDFINFYQNPASKWL